MQSTEFEQYFDFFPYLKKRFCGVFSIDTMPKNISYRHFCIVNTDLSTNSGRHWVVVLRNKKTSFEIFDSLGVTLEKEEILKQHSKFNIKYFDVNQSQFQQNNTSSCGHYCIYYSIQR
jgi:hypothetical protein